MRRLVVTFSSRGDCTWPTISWSPRWSWLFCFCSCDFFFFVILLTWWQILFLFFCSMPINRTGTLPDHFLFDCFTELWQRASLFIKKGSRLPLRRLHQGASLLLCIYSFPPYTFSLVAFHHTRSVCSLFLSLSLAIICFHSSHLIPSQANGRNKPSSHGAIAGSWVLYRF